MYLEHKSQSGQAKIVILERVHSDFEAATVLFSGRVVIRIEERVFKSVSKSV
jgi:hypothetical protein